MNKDIFKEQYKLFWPIAVAMFLSNFLSVIDSMMVTNYNPIAISAISIASQIQFIFGPIYFAIMSGVNIYSVQYYARNFDTKLKQLAGIAITLLLPLTIVNFFVVFIFQQQIIDFFAQNNQELTFLANNYLTVFRYSIIFVGFEMFFMYQYRAIKKPKLPMYIGIFQASLNIIFNFLFIFGNFGFPELGIMGAALGTVLARFSTTILYIILSIYYKAPFISKISTMFSYNKTLFYEVFINMLPLLIIEFLFGFGNVIFTKIYSLSSVADFTAFNIAKSTSFLLNSFVIATANVCGIMIGSAISTHKTQKDINRTLKNTFLFITLNSLILIILSLFILPKITFLFGETSNTSLLITQLIFINGIWMAIRTYSSSIIAILKSGNDNRFVILIDSGVTFIISIPITLIGLVLFGPNILILRTFIIIDVLLKVILGVYRLKQRKWIKKL